MIKNITEDDFLEPKIKTEHTDKMGSANSGQISEKRPTPR